MFKHFLLSINFKEPNVRKRSFRMFDKEQAKYANKLFGRFFSFKNSLIVLSRFALNSPGSLH